MNSIVASALEENFLLYLQNVRLNLITPSFKLDNSYKYDLSAKVWYISNRSSFLAFDRRIAKNTCERTKLDTTTTIKIIEIML